MWTASLRFPIVLGLVVSTFAMACRDRVCEVAFDATTATVGPVVEGTIIQYRFPFVTSGQGCRATVNAQAPCGAAAQVQWGEESGTPTHGTVEVSVETTGLSGTFVRRFIVQSDRNRSRPLTLQLNVDVVPEFLFSARVIDVGEPARPARTVSVDVAPSSDAHFIAVRSTVTGATVNWAMPDLAAGRSLRITAARDPSGGGLGVGGNVVILTSSRWTPEIRIPVRALLRRNP